VSYISELLNILQSPSFSNFRSRIGTRTSTRPTKDRSSSPTGLHFGFIWNLTSEDNPEEVTLAKPYSVRLDSRANLEHWKRRLEGAEIDRVRDLTFDVAPSYYSEMTGRSNPAARGEARSQGLS
jgi:hypothetical protein